MRERAKKYSRLPNANFHIEKVWKIFFSLEEKEGMEISLPLIFSRAINEKKEKKNIRNIERKHSIKTFKILCKF